MKYLLLLVVVILLWPSSTMAQRSEPNHHISLKDQTIRVELELGEKNQIIQLCDLVPGENYSLKVTNPMANSCQPKIRPSNLLKEDNDYQESYQFQATSKCQDIELSSLCQPVKENLIWFSVDAKDPETEVKSSAGIMTTVNGNPQSLIADVFIGGDCFDVTGAVRRGNPLSMGTFNGGASSIGIEEGIIISSGGIGNAQGPNTLTNASTDFLSNAGDPDLSQLTGGSINDVASIEFDFVPTVGVITFQYVFASEEYCDWVGSEFNDVFGFFLSGPGINGPYSNNAINIATLGDGTPVAINNINSSSNPGFYVDNVPVGQGQIGGGCVAAELNSNGFAVNDTEFDGFTTILTAVANVQACETYHIKLAVADVGDGVYDSAVFLAANSFSAGGTILAEAGVTGLGTSEITAYEGCGDAFFTFNRSGDDLSEPVDVFFNISSASTATFGADYAPFANFITIPAGESSYTLTIDILQDIFPEGIESIILELSNSCSCTSSTIEVFIEDPPPLFVFAPPILVCEGETSSITPAVSGGIPGYSFTWDDGSTGATLPITPNGPSSYSVTVEDQCGQIAATIINVETFVPTAELSGSASLCEGSPLPELEVLLTGPAPWEVTYSVDGFTNTITNIFDSPFYIPADLPGTYSLVSVTAMGCPGDVSGTGLVEIIEVTADLDITDITCYGEENGSIDLQVNTGIPPYTFDWNNGLSDQEDLTDLPEGNYEVLITDSLGCTVMVDTSLSQPTQLEFEIESIVDINCTNPDDGSISIAVNGGVAPYTFDWSNDSSEEDLNGVSGGLYTVLITDSLGCSIDTSANIVDHIAFPTAAALPEDIINCNNASILINGDNSSTGAEFSYQWLDDDGMIIPGETGNSLSTSLAGNYTLIVLDNNNFCADSIEVNVQEDFNIPNVDAGLPDTLTCTIESIQLDGSDSDDDDMTFLWSSMDGNIVNGESTLSPTINEPGTYTLEITSQINGCSDMDEVIIEEDVAIPDIEIAPTDLINCFVPEIALNGTGSSDGPEFTFLWQGLDGQTINNPTELIVQVQEGGNYELLIENTNNGCSTSQTVVVDENTTPPVSNAGFLLELSCATGTTFLEGEGSSVGPEYNYLWTTDEGNFLGDYTQLMNEVNVPAYYHLLVTDTNNGCTALDSVLVTENTNAPDAEAAVEGILNCDITTLELDGTGSDFGSNFEITWTSEEGYPIENENTLNPIITQPGTYIINVLDLTNSCQSVASVMVDQNIIAPMADAGPPSTLTCFDPAYQLDGTDSDQGDPFEVNWSTLNGDPVGNTSNLQPIISQAGIYTITVLNTENGCSTTDEVQILADQEDPTADAGPDQILNCAIESVILQASGSSTGADFDFTWSVLDGNSIAFTNLEPVSTEPGIFQLLITDITNGCEALDTVAITTDYTPPVASIAAPEILNCYQPSINLNAQGFSTGAIYNYNWSVIGSGNIVNLGTDELNPEVDAIGTYQLVVTNTENFCQDSIQINVTQDFVAPNVSIEPAEELTCTVTELVLNANGSSIGSEFEYEWTNLEGHEIEQNTSLMPTISNTGFYVLEIVNTQNGCSSSDQIEIIQDPDIPEAIILEPEILTCTVQSIQLDAGNSTSGTNITYSWQSQDGHIISGQNGINPLVDQAGTYTLNITNLDNSCTTEESILVEIDTLHPQAIAGENGLLDCIQTSLILDGTGSSEGNNFTYQWSSNDGQINADATSLNPTIISPGTYQLAVLNTQNGCQNVDLVSVAIDTLSPILSIAEPDLLTCNTESISIQSTASGNAELEYLWTTNTGSILNGEESLTVEVNAPGIYQLQVSNLGNGCINQSSVEVPIDTLSPSVDAGFADLLTCEIQSIQLEGTANANGPLEFLWTTPGGNIQNGANTLAPQVNAAGIYILQVTNLSNGCEAQDQVQVDLDDDVPQAVIVDPQLLSCTATSVLLTGMTNEGSIPFDFQWMDEQGNPIGLDNTHSIEVDHPGIYQLIVTNPENGCFEITQTQVEQDIENPIAEAGIAEDLNCMLTSLELNGSNSSQGTQFVYSWTSNDGNLTSGATTLNPIINAPGTYELFILNQQNGCTDTDWVLVEENVPVLASVNTDPPPCFGDLASIEVLTVNGGVAPYIYSIDGGGIFQDNRLFSNIEPGNYDVVVQDANGCEIEQNIIIIEPIPVEVDLEVQTTIRFGDSIQLFPILNYPESDVGSVQWSPADGLSCTDCLNPFASPHRTIEYHVIVANKNGCEEEADIRLIVDRTGSVYVPNAFSPNEDGTNDVFYIHAKDNTVAQVNSLMIFNRWGELVYDVYNFPPNDPQFGWDGTHRGEIMNAAVFVYWTEVELLDGTKLLLKGDVTLMK